MSSLERPASWRLEARRSDDSPHMRWTGRPVPASTGLRAFSSPPGTRVEHFGRDLNYVLDHWCIAVFPRSHYNVMADFDQAGAFQRAYVNLATVADIGQSSVAWTDLWVDVIFPKKGEPRIVDEAELWEALGRGEITEECATSVAALARKLQASHSPLFRATTLDDYLECIADRPAIAQ